MSNIYQSSKELLRSLFSLLPVLKRAVYFSFAVNILVLAPTVYMLQVYDRVVNSRSVETLLMLTILVVGANALMEVFEWARKETLSVVGDLLDTNLAERVFYAVFQANLRQQKIASPAVFGDFRTVRDFLTSPAVIAVLDAPASVIFVVLIFIINPILGAVSLGVAFIQLLLTYLTERTTRVALNEASKEAIRAQAYATASFRNAEVSQAMGMRPQLHDRWMAVQKRFLQLQADASNQVAGTAASAKFFQLLQGSLVIGLGTWLFLIGEFPGGGGLMMVASIIAGRAIAPIGQVIATWKVIISARQSYQRLDNLLSAVPPARPTMSLPAPVGKLSVDSVSACPPGGNSFLLRNVSFSLEPGVVLGIVGPSASGKSSLARLLVGVWMPQSGRVRLDGADVAQWNKEELGPYLGYLPQDVELFEGSLGENIARFGERDIVKLEDAASRAGLLDWINTLESGYDTLIGEGGEALSGGQRQRVALARAIYGRPKLIVLDEPNASLDQDGEQSLINTLICLKAEGATVVVITHRTSVLAAVDQLLILRDGSVVKMGPKEEVLAALSQPPARQPQ